MKPVFTFLTILWLFFICLGVIGYFKNIYKLTQCDFEAPYKAEVIHTVGLVPVVGTITGWMDFGK